MTWRLLAVVALGGAIGSVARFALGALAAPLGATLPWGTIAINVIGSFVIGFFGTLTLDVGVSSLRDDKGKE